MAPIARASPMAFRVVIGSCSTVIPNTTGTNTYNDVNGPIVLTSSPDWDN